MVSRIAVLGLILLTASACSRLPSVPAAYSSLPAVTPGRDAVVAAVPSRAAPAVPVAALPVVRIPGTPLARGAGERAAALVNPTDILAASARARLAWQTLRPTELTRRSFIVNRDALERSVVETGTVGAGKRVAAVEAPTYDREAMMARLEREGRFAAKPICSGC